MNKIKITSAAIVCAMLGGTTWFYRRAEGSERPAYRTAAVERTSLKSTVSATGKLNAVRTVQVGTQVSGQIAEIFVDFNDKVKKGQLLARIDPKLQEQAVQDAQAQLERAQAQLAQAQDEYTRNKQLFDARVITPVEFGATKANFSVQQAGVKSAAIALDRAKQNLAYTSIYAPIDGVIVERNVDVGQTVAASLSAPQLFLIANDLSEMQILASVDESDIGAIKEGQPVQFTVQSYPNQTFNGRVQQVRLQSTLLDNVVNYTAVVNLPNADGRLLPGMTATVQFLTATADNVLTVPNAALRIRPTAEMQDELKKQIPRFARDDTSGVRRADTTARRDTAARFAGRARGDSARAGRGGGGNARASSAMVWYLDSAGALHATRVRVGLSDGQRTEVTSAALHEGMQIVTGLPVTNDQTPAPSAASTNPLQPQRGGGPGAAGRRGF
jgi:HlyD family secretion protein